MNAELVEHITRATVRLPRLGGQGVLVAGGFVVTAAHCIGWTATGGMTLGDRYVEEVVTAEGRRLRARPLAVEPVNDLAILGALDGEESDETAAAAEAFDDFCEATEPVTLALAPLCVGSTLDVFVFTHNRGVVHGSATIYAANAPRMAVRTEQPIDGGTSGGPIVTRDGALVAVVSCGTVAAGDACTFGTRVQLVAPLWLVRRMVPRAVALTPDHLPPPPPALSVKGHAG